MAKKIKKDAFSFKGYLQMSRDLGKSLVLVIPLFVLYQIGILMTGGIRNGVDFVSDVLFLITEGSMLGYLGINLGVVLAFIGGVFYLKRRGDLNPRVFPFVVAESTVYALLLGGAVVQLMSSLGMGALLSTGGAGDYGILTSFVLSIGAGLYEETVFRLVMMGGLFWAGVKFLDIPEWMSAAAAVLVSSLIFSGVHYIGDLGDAFTLGSFMFRFFAGVLLAVIFYLRGFAVAVYTHAIYDIIVLVFN